MMMIKKYLEECLLEWFNKHKEFKDIIIDG